MKDSGRFQPINGVKEEDDIEINIQSSTELLFKNKNGNYKSQVRNHIPIFQLKKLGERQ